MWFWLSHFLFAFLSMEFMAWAAHRYLMHGFLWCLHEDHHVVRKDQIGQKNDFFALFFAIPSVCAIYYGVTYSISFLSAQGFGIAFYGLAYFVVHEVIIHRRWRLFNMSGSYIDSIKESHRKHHMVRHREGARNFGMLIPAREDWVKARRQHKRIQRAR